jgi:hypothetical protein
LAHDRVGKATERNDSRFADRRDATRTKTRCYSYRCRPRTRPQREAKHS